MFRTQRTKIDNNHATKCLCIKQNKFYFQTGKDVLQLAHFQRFMLVKFGHIVKK